MRSRWTPAQRRAEIVDACDRLGLSVTPFGKAFEIRGNGVDLIVNDLGNLTKSDLLPYRG